jgi:hypothetical protein
MHSNTAIWMAATISHREAIAKTEKTANHFMAQSFRTDLSDDETSFCANMAAKLQAQAFAMKARFPRIEQF